jgi:hypothetical protein
MFSLAKTGWLKFLLLIPIIITIWVPRGLELDRFVTPDEPKWLTRSVNFYLALTQGDFPNTYQKEHPGVTVMWAETAGFLWRFPWYITEKSDQYANPQKFQTFIEQRGYTNVPMHLLIAGRNFIVLANVIVLALAFLAAVRLLGLIPALVGFLLIALDPFSIALSRLLHPDALLSTLMFLSLLAFMNFLYRGHHLFDLALSAIAAGLAWLTKSPSFFLIPFFGLLIAVEIGCSWRMKKQGSPSDVWGAFWPLLSWAGIATLVFVFLWPAMWGDPIGTLRMVFGEAFTYAAEGHYSPTFFNGQIYQSGITDWSFYPVNYLWRTTPPVLIGLVFGGVAMIFRRRLSFYKEQQRPVLILLLYAVLFTFFMTLGSKKFDRYLIPVFTPLALATAVGWVVMSQNVLSWITTRLNRVEAGKIKPYGAAIILALVIIIQLAGSIQSFPYYFTYYNPLMGGSRRAPEVMMIGWGEGLDQAARYLNVKPDAKKLSVQSWYDRGPFSYIFEGVTINKDFPASPAELQKADYYVLYFHQWQRQLPSEEFIQYFDGLQPEHIVSIDGLEYARIYRGDESPE